MKDNLKQMLNSFKNEVEPRAVKKISRVTKRHRKQYSSSIDYKDLNPSLSSDLKIIFVGYNPGIQSSIQQHHYAHHSNLFWKLFNKSGILFSVLKSCGIEIKESTDDQLLSSLISSNEEGVLESNVQAKNDFDLVKYRIGFTDLVLKCTRTAEELTNTEKLSNIPRLIKEFNNSEVENIIFVGKGIWQMIVKFYSINYTYDCKISKENFSWGLQSPGKDDAYNKMLLQFKNDISHQCNIYVFPNTSGLVASLSFQQKLDLWDDLAKSILDN